MALEWTRNGYNLQWNNKDCASATVSGDHPLIPAHNAGETSEPQRVFTLGFTSR